MAQFSPNAFALRSNPVAVFERRTETNGQPRRRLSPDGRILGPRFRLARIKLLSRMASCKDFPTNVNTRTNEKALSVARSPHKPPALGCRTVDAIECKESPKKAHDDPPHPTTNPAWRLSSGSQREPGGSPPERVAVPCQMLLLLGSPADLVQLLGKMRVSREIHRLPLAPSGYRPCSTLPASGGSTYGRKPKWPTRSGRTRLRAHRNCANLLRSKRPR